jgi:hypothetical protein
MGSVHGKEARMTDMPPEQRAEFREKAAASMDRGAATSKAALAHMRFSKIVAWTQLVLLAVIAAGVWLR